MGENFIHSFQRREKLENPKILSTHSKGERGWKRVMGENFYVQIKKERDVWGRKKNCSPLPKEDVEERKIKLSIHFQRRESLGGNEKKKTTHSKREKNWKQNQQENKISTQIVKEEKLWDGKTKTNHYERKGCFIISLATQFLSCVGHLQLTIFIRCEC